MAEPFSEYNGKELQELKENAENYRKELQELKENAEKTTGKNYKN